MYFSRNLLLLKQKFLHRSQHLKVHQPDSLQLSARFLTVYNLLAVNYIFIFMHLFNLLGENLLMLIHSKRFYN